MKLLRAFLPILMFSAAMNCNAAAQGAPATDRQVAITVDDLPAGSSDSMSAATINDMTAKIVAALRDVDEGDGGDFFVLKEPIPDFLLYRFRRLRHSCPLQS